MVSVITKGLRSGSRVTDVPQIDFMLGLPESFVQNPTSSSCS